MAIPDNRLSTEPIVADYIDPNGRDTVANEAWEGGPVAIGDTTQGRNNQAWKLTFAGGTFTLTPEDTGSPVDVLTGQTSVQCSFGFDQNGRPSIAWVTGTGQGYLYWYDTGGAGDYVITAFHNPVASVGLTMDDKRVRQIATCDLLLFYTIEDGQDHALYFREQRDRFDTAHLLQKPVWPYIQKIGMNQGLRVQLDLSTEAPV